MIEIMCMDDPHYKSVMDFIKIEHLEKMVKKWFKKELKIHDNNLQELIDDCDMDIIDVIAEDYLKKVYPKDHWQRSLIWETDDYSDGFKLIIYKVEFNNKKDATKFIVNTIQKLSIEPSDLFEEGIKNIK